MSMAMRVLKSGLAINPDAIRAAAEFEEKEKKKRAAMNILSAMSLLSMGDLISGVNSIPRMHGRRLVGTGRCKCGKTISANKEQCLDCATESVENAKAELRKVVFGA